MEKETRITAPEGCKETKVYKISAPNGCEIEKVEIVDGMAVVTFKQKERKLPKSWEEFCEMYPAQAGESYIDGSSVIITKDWQMSRNKMYNKNVLPDRATAEAVLSLCQLIQLRDAFNGDWVPDWAKNYAKFIISFNDDGTVIKIPGSHLSDLLYFKTQGLCDEFLRYFRDLIEKLKPLYGIKEGGGE